MGFYWSFGITWNFRTYILIMTSWKTYKLGDVVNILDNRRIPLSAREREQRHGEYPYYGAQGIIDYVDDYLFNGTYLLIAEDGENLRSKKQNIAQLVSGKYWVNNHAHILESNGLCDIRYICYLLNIIDISGYITGSAQPKLNQANLLAISISLPPLEEQRRIAGILGAIDDKIENNRRINTNLELQAQALFEEWISKSNTSKGVFDDIIQTTLAGDWGQETTQGNYTHEVFCIRGADIPALQNGDKGKMPIRYILEKNYKTKQLRTNDLVIEISGGSPTQSTGRICMITQSLLDRLGKDVVCTNFCRAITPKSGYAIYIYLYWQMLYNKNTMFSYENGTTGIKNLNIADLISKEPIEIPAQEDVEKLNIVLQPIFDQIYANGLQNETLATLRDTLLPKLMNGEIKL